MFSLVRRLIDRYRKCKAEQMFTPPYAGKAPSQVTEKDVAEFRRAVYQALQKTGPMHAQA